MSAPPAATIRGRTGAFVLAVRPKTLPAALTPVLVGCGIAIARDGFRPLPALCAAAGALLIQVGTNFANDLFDFEKGADTAERIGPLRVTQAGLLSPREIRAGMYCAFLLAGLAGAYLVTVAGWPIVWIGIASIAAGVAYTGGPFPLGYNGLGDLFVMVFFGFVAVCGTVYVQLLRVPPEAWGWSLAVGSLATAMLVVNNVRDLPTDRRAGKRTVPVIFGRRTGVAEYALMLVIPLAVPPALLAFGLAGWTVLLPLATAPEGLRLVFVVSRRRDGATLNRALAATARLSLVYGLLLFTGLVLPGWAGS